MMKHKRKKASSLVVLMRNYEKEGSKKSLRSAMTTTPDYHAKRFELLSFLLQTSCAKRVQGIIYIILLNGFTGSDKEPY